MTRQDYNLLNWNFRLTLVGILTLIGCTATFVWKGAEYANQVQNSLRDDRADINRHTSDIYHLSANDQAQDKKIILIENKLAAQ